MLYYSSIFHNVPWDLFFHVFSFGMHVCPINLITATMTEESIVNLLATTKQNWCRDDGHVLLSFSGGFPPLWKTTVQKIQDHYLAVVESKLPLPQIPLQSTVSPRQAQDTWWICQLEKFVETLKIPLWLHIGGEEPVCFLMCEGEVLWALDKTEVEQK